MPRNWAGAVHLALQSNGHGLSPLFQCWSLEADINDSTYPRGCHAARLATALPVKIGRVGLGAQ